MIRGQWTADREYRALGTPQDVCKCLDGNPPPWVEKREDEKLEIDMDNITIEESELDFEEKEYRKQANVLIDELFPGDKGSLPAGEFSRRMQLVIDFMEKWNENHKA